MSWRNAARSFGIGSARAASCGDTRAEAACWHWLAFVLAALGPSVSGPPVAAQAGGSAEVVVAVAANFAAAQAELAVRFTAATGHSVTASLGSTGQLYAQIRNGAPFDVFLSADAERPRMLEAQGLAVEGTLFTYALGRLALFGARARRVRPDGADLRAPDYRHIAIANPRTAPYGAAAEQVLRALDLMDVVADRLVRGESIAQAHQFVKSGAAEWGLVALAQVLAEPKESYWVVPDRLHEPIVQDAVLLARAASNEAARAYMRFLASVEARSIIESFGYGTAAADTTPRGVRGLW